jgi:hypothetical protein
MNTDVDAVEEPVEDEPVAEPEDWVTEQVLLITLEDGI